MDTAQYLWVCPVGVAMVPDGNPKKLEPMIRKGTPPGSFPIDNELPSTGLHQHMKAPPTRMLKLPLVWSVAVHELKLQSDLAEGCDMNRLHTEGEVNK